MTVNTIDKTTTKRFRKVKPRLARSSVQDKVSIGNLKRLRVMALVRPHRVASVENSTVNNSDPKASKHNGGDCTRLSPRIKRLVSATVPWANTRDEGKLHAIFTVLGLIALKQKHTMYAMTLNLGPSQQKRVLDNPTTCLKRLHRSIRERLARILGRNPTFSFALEFTDTGRPHLHGLFVFDSALRLRVEKALIEVGGKWDNTRHKERQLELNDCVHYVHGWATYVGKHTRGAQKRLGVESVVCASNWLRSQARDYWEGGRTYWTKKTSAPPSDSPRTSDIERMAPRRELKSDVGIPENWKLSEFCQNRLSTVLDQQFRDRGKWQIRLMIKAAHHIREGPS